MSKRSEYKRVPGRSSIINPMRSSLWLGEDHLLLVSHGLVAETYRRFPLTSIQSIVMSQTGRGRIYNWVLGAFAVLLLGMTILIGVFSPLHAFGPGFQLGVVLILALINVARGPTCRTQLRTAVQTVDLGSLSRLRRARKSLEILVSRIEAAQGSVAAESLAELNADGESIAMGMQAAPVTAVPAVQAPREARLLTYCRGRAHSVLFTTALGVGFCSIATLLIPSAASSISILSAVLLLGLLGCGVGAGVAQYGSTMPLRLKILTWSISGYQAAIFFVTVILTVALLAVQFGDDGNTSQITNHIAYQLFTMIHFALSALQGALGLVWLARYRSTAAPPTANRDE